MGISPLAVKKMVKQMGSSINDSAAEAIAKLLEQKAKSIARYSVARAKKNGRQVKEEDVEAYRLKFGG
jgi:histone H3/H4